MCSCSFESLPFCCSWKVASSTPPSHISSGIYLKPSTMMHSWHSSRVNGAETPVISSSSISIALSWHDSLHPLARPFVFGTPQGCPIGWRYKLEPVATRSHACVGIWCIMCLMWSLSCVTSGSCATWPGNTELGRNRKTKGFWTLASARALRLPWSFYRSPVIWGPEKIGKIQCKLFPKGGMLRKGSMKVYEGFEWIQEVKSFKKRQEVPGKRFRMSEVSGGLEKCMEASEWCREARKVWKGVKFGNQEGAGRLQGRIPSGRTCKT